MSKKSSYMGLRRSAGKARSLLPTRASRYWYIWRANYSISIDWSMPSSPSSGYKPCKIETYASQRAILKFPRSSISSALDPLFKLILDASMKEFCVSGRYCMKCTGPAASTRSPKATIVDNFASESKLPSISIVYRSGISWGKYWIISPEIAFDKSEIRPAVSLVDIASHYSLRREQVRYSINRCKWGIILCSTVAMSPWSTNRPPAITFWNFWKT